MKGRIKFSDEMLAAVIDGRKTQARRLMKSQPKLTESNLPADGYTLSEQVCSAWRAGFIDDDCPYGQAGDVIPFADKDGNIKGEIEIVDVWLQQVQDISEEDAVAEGVAPLHGGYWKHYQPGWTQHQLSARGSFVTLWNSINGVDAWNKNPWVWVIEFKQIQEG
ncbi:ASCH domain-containing protein [Morganella morganii]